MIAANIYRHTPEAELHAMKTSESLPRSRIESIEATAHRLRALEIDPLALERAAEAGRILATLTDDSALIDGTIVYEAIGARVFEDPAPGSLDDGVISVAAELARFGDFGLGAAWGQAISLDSQQAQTLRRMLLTVVSDPRLVVARLAVQLARLRHARDLNASQQSALAAEARAVFAPLANRLGIWQIKWELEDLAFRYLQPDDYGQIAKSVSTRRETREAYIAEFCETLSAELARAGVSAEVRGRPKHLYSIWRKMQRKQLAISGLYDLLAVRILCESVPQCYAALGVVHGRWPYLPGEFDDYIATPKDNRYRSIHTAVVGPQNQPVEVQIRSHEMHEQAELGVAAHWHYKEGGERRLAEDRKIDWVRRILDGRTGSDADPDFIERSHTQLFGDRVFALTPRGEVVELPAGATPLDFAYQVHTGLGNRCRGAKVDGRIVPLTYQVKTGEVVEIIAGKQPAPSRDWLSQEQGFIVSPRSRAKLRAHFRRLDAGANELAGRVIVERELARAGQSGEIVPALASDLKATDVSQLYRWIGEAEISTTQLSQALQRRQERSSTGAGQATASPSALPAARRKAKRTVARSSSPVVIEGVGDLPVTLARCCAPVRPQAIAGYVTQGRGVTVHELRCKGLQRMQAMHPERVLRVNWRDAGEQLPVEIEITAWDRQGLLRDLSEVIAAEKLSIDALNTRTDHKEGTATTSISVGVADQAQLARILRQLGRVSGAISARRIR